MSNDDEAMAIDPALALEILPQKISERKRIIASLALDLSILSESTFGDPAENETLEKSLRSQRDFLRLYEARLDAIRRAAGGG